MICSFDGFFVETALLSELALAALGVLVGCYLLVTWWGLLAALFDGPLARSGV